MSKEEVLAHQNSSQNKETTCAGIASNPAVVLQDCSNVGTASFYTNGTNVTAADVSATVPTIANSCGAPYTTTGTWKKVNPDPGVNIIDLQITGGSVASGNHDVWVQFFQGADCASLTAIGCSKLVQVAMGLRIPINVHQEGVNPSQDLWMYIWDDSNKAFNLNVEVIGSSSTTITNDDCANASTSPDGCNLGAGPESWTGPNNNGRTCTGGTWYSNENTTYFSITASATTGSIGVTGINCNDGTSGEAQFGVWNSCACVGTYTAGCFRSCAVGTGTLNLSSLTPGSTYILVVDGQAGDICTWTFNTTGILLPVELMNFGVKSQYDGNLISWNTQSERECAYYIVQRSTDGEMFSDIAKIDGNGTTNTLSEYSFLDQNHSVGVNYYRLVQVDLSGESQYFAPVAVTNDLNGINIYPNPVANESEIRYGSSFDGESELKIYDASGKTVLNTTVRTYKGLNEQKVNTTSFESGIYILNLSNEKEAKMIRFIK